jgi:PAS domain S-box-containing protein
MQGSDMKILIIDDCHDNLMPLAELLEGYLPGCLVEMADSGAAGIELASSFQPDTILLDINMPEMDGFETCKLLKNDLATQHIPVIFLSAYKADCESRIRGLEIGGDAFLSKPFDTAELVAVVRAMARIKQTEDALRMEKASLERLVSERTATLRESEARFTNAFDAAAVGMAVVSLEGRWMKVNRLLCDMLGYPAAELAGKTFQDITHPDDLAASMANDRELVAGKISSYKTEKRYLHKSGRIVWVVLHASLVRDQLGKPLYFVGQIEDVTAAKQLEKIQLFLSQYAWSAQGEDFFQALARFLAETLEMDYVIIDRLGSGIQAAGRLAFHANGRQEAPGTYGMEGLPGNEVVKSGFCCFPKDICRLFPQDLDLQRLHAESYVGIALRNSQGTPIGLIAVIGCKPLANPPLAESALRLVSLRAAGELEHRQAESQIQENEKRYRALFTGITEGFALHEIICDDQGDPCDYRFLEVNPAFERLTGLQAAAVIGRRQSELAPNEDPAWIKRYGQVALTGIPCTFENYSPVFQRHYNVFAYSPAPRQFAVLFLDISERKQAYELLRQSQQRFVQVTESLNEWIWEVDASGLYTYCSDAAEKILGYASAELVGKKHFYDLFTQDVREELKTAALAAFQRKQPFFGFENPNLHKNGHVVILETSGSPMLDAQGGLLGYRGADTDITERKQAERALRASEAKLGKMIANIADVIGVLDAQGVVQYCSPNIERLFGWQRQDLVGQKAWKTVHPDDLDNAQAIFLDLLKSPMATRAIEIRYLCKDNRYRIIELTATNLIDDPNIQGILVNFHDITERKQAELDLRASEAKLGKMIANIADVIAILDSRGIAQYCSTNIERLFGWRPEDVVGENAWKVIHPDDVGRMQDLFSNHLKEPMTTNVSEFRCLCKDGSYRTVELTATNLFNDPNIQGLLLNFHDITERKKTEDAIRESEQKYRMLTENMKDVVWTADAETQKFLYVSPSVEKLRGYTAAEVMAQPMYAALGQQHQGSASSLVRQSIADLRAGKITPETYLKDEFEQPCKDGSRIWTEIITHLWQNPRTGKIEMHGVTRDITERKKAERDLQVYKDHLEELVELRTTELSEARDQAQAANRAKSAFLANMSHELRTPLTAVIGFAQVMSHSPSTSAKERENLGIILRSGEHLLTLINDILDLSKIEAGRVELDQQDLDLGELLRDVTDMMRGRAEAKGLLLVVEQSPAFPRFANTDPGKIRQIIINLIGNAVKFTQAGQVTIRLDASRTSKGQLLKLEVEDTGRGIAEEDLEAVFQPFVQIQSKSRTTEGTGLGLAITRQYVQMLGGTISVDSRFGKGSCFRLAIPVGEVTTEGAEALAGRLKAIGIESQTSGIRVLIVEDQMENRLLLRTFLGQFGFQVREVVNGEEAIATVQEWQPRLIFMDRRMPVLDGLVATRRIRALPGGQEPIIIAVSAHTFKEEQREMLEAGCNGFLCKPFAFSDLLDTLGEHLNLQLSYEEKPAEIRMLNPDDLRPIPPAQLKTLLRLILEGQHDDLIAWLNRQTVLSQEAAQIMQKLLDEYKFEVLAKTIETVMAEK